MESLFLMYLLKEAEGRVEAADSFEAMRAELEKIRAQQLYLASPDTGRRGSFKRYCRVRWGFDTIPAAPDSPIGRESG